MSHTPPSSYSPLPHQSGYTGSTSMAERNDLHDMTPEELELECQHLRDENHQLQLRILGVNELARLLQDRSELVQVLEEKNKRLEIAVVRLESRCANYDRMLKSQKGANVPTAKPGQSPFIPGPSRQILEGLMKENSDLKKTVSNLTGKGAASYLEAVKATQLEEIIDQQKQEIEFLKDQINQLTSTGIIEEKTESSVGQLSSLPATVSDSGPLKRQLIQLQRAMKVKDRFCTLLSQQVAQLQNRLASLEYEAQDGNEPSPSQPQQESNVHEQAPQLHKRAAGTDDQGDGAYKKLYEEANDTLAKEREQRLSLVDKMTSIESELKEKKKTIDKLEQRCDELTSYHQTLLMEKKELSDVLTETQQRMESLSISGSENRSPQRGGATSGKTVEQLQKELKSSADQISDLRAQLEEANVRTAISDSKLGEIESKHAQQLGEYESMITVKNQEVRNYLDKINQNEQHIFNLNEQIKDLDEEIRGQRDEYSNLLREISEGKYSHSSRGGITSAQLRQMSAVKSGGAPSLFGLETPIGPDEVTTPSQAPKIRNPSVPLSVISRGPPEEEPQKQTQKQPPNNLDLHSTPHQQGRASPGPQHVMHQQMIQSKGPQQPHPQQLQTPATPVASVQSNHAAILSYTHPIGPSVGGGGISGVSGGGYMTSGVPPTTQTMFGAGSVPIGYGQPRVSQQQSQGMQHNRPRTMPISMSPSPTPGTSNLTLIGGVAAGRTPYTTSYGYPPGSNIPISTVSQYTTGTGMQSSTYPSGYAGGGVPTSGYGTVRTNVRPGQVQYGSSGQVFGGMSGNSHASHLYNTGPSYSNTSPQLPRQQQFQHQVSYSRTESGSSGYQSGDIHSGGIPGGSVMRPTSPRTSFNQQAPSGGYPGGQGGPSGQYGSSPRDRSYDPSGGYQGGQGGGTGFPPPRGHH